jgi:hypothetical protein
MRPPYLGALVPGTPLHSPIAPGETYKVCVLCWNDDKKVREGADATFKLVGLRAKPRGPAPPERARKRDCLEAGGRRSDSSFIDRGTPLVIDDEGDDHVAAPDTPAVTLVDKDGGGASKRRKTATARGGAVAMNVDASDGLPCTSFSFLAVSAAGDDDSTGNDPDGAASDMRDDAIAARYVYIWSDGRPSRFSRRRRC